MPTGKTRVVSERDVAIGARIRLRRREVGLTQTDLANALGLTFQQIQKYERGINRVAASRLSLLAAALDCPVAYLLGESGDGTPAVAHEAVIWLAEPGALELLGAYTRIKAPRSRRAVLAMVRAMAPSEGAAELSADAAYEAVP